MTDLARDDGAGVAEVVIFRRSRTREDEVREIGDAFPGWRVWYSDWSHTWNAHREDAKPYFGPVVGPAFIMSAYSAAELVILLEDQVRIDIAAEFPDWRVSRIAAGGWHAVGHGQADGDSSVTRIVGHTTVVGLHAAPHWPEARSCAEPAVAAYT